MKINCLIKLIVLLSGLFMSAGSQAAITDAEQVILQAFYSSTGGPSWTNKAGWLDASVCTPDSLNSIICVACDADGITCDADDNVSAIELNNNNLVGNIPASTGQLSNLLRLSLQDNQLRGSIPKELGSLSKLVTLRLYNNQLEGPIPADLKYLTNLLHFELYNNKLSGQLPLGLGGLRMLWNFYINGNQFIGELPLDLDTIGLDATSPPLLNLKWNAVFSSDATLNSFINKYHANLDLYEDSQTLAPSILIWSDKSATSVDLTWSTFDTNPSRPGGYKILQSVTETGDYSVVETITDRLARNFTINGLDPGVNYWFKICSYTDQHIENINTVISVDSDPVSKQVPTLTVTSSPGSTVDEHTLVEMTATGDSSVMNYSWSELSSSGVTLNVDAINSPDKASFTAPEVSTTEVLVFRATGYDDFGDVGYQDIQITVNNVIVAPTVNPAVVGSSTVDEGAPVTINANASDANGSIVKYEWQQISGPAAVNVTGQSSSSLQFDAPAIDTASETLEFKVTVTDNDGEIATENVVVMVMNVKVAPTVTAGTDQIVNEGYLVTLTPSAADDANGTIESYLWEQISGPDVSISNHTTANASFTTPYIETSSLILIFTITVTDNDGQTASDTLSVTVNNAPTVTAGTDQTVNEGDSVSLSAIASDGDESTLSYSWEQVSGSPAVTINAATSALAGFTAPGIDTASITLEFKVTVTDGNGAIASDTVQFTVNNVIIAPTVNPSVENSSSVLEGDTVTINANAGDANGNIVEYQWTQVSGPDAIPGINKSLATLQFIAPAISTATESLVFSVTVTDDDGGTASATVQVTVNNLRIEPTVKASEDQVVDEGSMVTLSVTESVDDNGTIIGHSWSQISGATQVVLTPSATNPAIVTFEAPKVQVAGDVLVFEVTVTDNDGDTGTDQVQITVNDVKIGPETNPNSDQPGDEVEEGNWIELNANAFDVDGEVVTYHWEQLLGQPVELETTDTPTTRFEAPSITNRSVRLLFRVTVTDDDELIGRGLIYVIVTKRNVIVVGNGGGALSWYWLLLLAAPLLARRYLK